MRIARLVAAAALVSLTALPAFAADTAAQAGSSSGDTCTTQSPTKMPFSKMTVGFFQSENLQNPFRAAETKSVRDAAEQMGVKRLLYANANSDQAKQVSDIQSMINQGANALIIAPLNATGLKPTLVAAKAKHIPVVTIDRQTAAPSARTSLPSSARISTNRPCVPHRNWSRLPTARPRSSSFRAPTATRWRLRGPRASRKKSTSMTA